MQTRQVTALATAVLLMFTGSAFADLSISKNPTHDMSCSGGVCTATAKGANLNVDDLTNMLASGDIAVKTSDDLNIDGGLAVMAAVRWSSNARLTLSARHNIIVKSQITVAGKGALTIAYGTYNPDSDLLLQQRGRIRFSHLESQLVIDGQPYVLVNTVSGLSTAVAANPSGFFAFASDYDAATDGTINHAPVAELDGVLNGLGNSIANLSVSTGGRYSRTGLVGLNRGIIRNLDLVDVSISNWTNVAYAAGLAGLNYGTINHCSVSGIIQGIAWMGGLVSYNAGTVVASRVSANVHGRQNVGGVVGINRGEVSQSYATGNLLGRSEVGGIVGDNSEANITDTYFTGSLGRARTWGAGGLVGYTLQGGVSTSYSTGLVQGSVRGGVIGFERDTAGKSATYWDLDTSGIADPSKGCGNIDNCPGVTGLTDAQLKSGLPDGFDPHIWGQNPNINNGYPYLLANPPTK